MTAPAGLVVVGASLAGLRAVLAARKSGYDGPITLVGAEDHLPYDRPPLSKEFLTAEPADPDRTTFAGAESLEDEGVTVLLGTHATRLDLTAREIHTDSGAPIPYESLVIATGSHARTLDGTNLEGIHVLRTVDDAITIRTALDAGHHVVVVGGGFIGSEIASEAQRRGNMVTIVEAEPQPLVRAVGPQMAPALVQVHARNGVDVLTGVAVTDFGGDEHVEQVCLSDGTTLEADVVIVGIGADPAVDWLEGSGLRLDNGIVCDETLRAADHVYAAGDVARWTNPLFEESMRLQHWTSAAEQGAAAARNALDPASATAYSTVPYFWSDWYDDKIQMVGVADADEVLVVGDTDDTTWLALYRSGDRLTGALTLNQPGKIMKYRRLIANSAIWQDALDLAGASPGDDT